MRVTLDTAAPGDESSDIGVLTTVKIKQAESDIFISTSYLQVTMKDGTDTLLLTIPKAIARDIFGKLGDALQER